MKDFPCFNLWHIRFDFTLWNSKKSLMNFLWFPSYKELFKRMNSIDEVVLCLGLCFKNFDFGYIGLFGFDDNFLEKGPVGGGGSLNPWDFGAREILLVFWNHNKNIKQNEIYFYLILYISPTFPLSSHNKINA